MFIQIKPNNGIAIYDQIVRQVKFAIADGVLQAGELVPSVRELAKHLAINPNTVARAYNLLQTDDVLESLRGTGLEVAKGAAKQCRQERLQLIRERLKSVVQEAHQSGLDTDELQTMFEKEIRTLPARRQS